MRDGDRGRNSTEQSCAERLVEEDAVLNSFDLLPDLVMSLGFHGGFTFTSELINGNVETNQIAECLIGVSTRPKVFFLKDALAILKVATLY